MIRSKKIKKVVKERAKSRCEYCRIQEDDSFLTFEIEHIVSQKHGGGDELENLAYACPQCNQFKGTDLITFLDDYDNIVTLFNPRKQDWFEYFEVLEGEIIGKNKVAKATIKLLKINATERIIIREILMKANRYP